MGDKFYLTENCKKTIKTCEETLKVYTLDRFSLQYAIIQNNLGHAYSRLVEAG